MGAIGEVIGGSWRLRGTGKGRLRGAGKGILPFPPIPHAGLLLWRILREGPCVALQAMSGGIACRFI